MPGAREPPAARALALQIPAQIFALQRRGPSRKGGCSCVVVVARDSQEQAIGQLKRRAPRQAGRNFVKISAACARVLVRLNGSLLHARGVQGGGDGNGGGECWQSLLPQEAGGPRRKRVRLEKFLNSFCRSTLSYIIPLVVVFS